MKEIERKFLIKDLPDLSLLPCKKIKQGYLNADSEPILRIRMIDDKYFLTYKFADKKVDNINICTEYELPITKEAFEHLVTKIDGNMLEKTRYYLKENDYTYEIDVFEGKYAGVILAEIEFKNEEEAKNYIKPYWLKDDVTSDKRYRNAYMALNER